MKFQVRLVPRWMWWALEGSVFFLLILGLLVMLYAPSREWPLNNLVYWSAVWAAILTHFVSKYFVLREAGNGWHAWLDIWFTLFLVAHSIAAIAVLSQINFGLMVKEGHIRLPFVGIIVSILLFVSGRSLARSVQEK